MEPAFGRGSKGGGGMKRGKQTLLLMVAMVGSMALVLCWEASPFNVVYPQRPTAASAEGDLSVDAGGFKENESAPGSGDEEGSREEILLPQKESEGAGDEFQSSAEVVRDANDRKSGTTSAESSSSSKVTISAKESEGETESADENADSNVFENNSTGSYEISTRDAETKPDVRLDEVTRTAKENTTGSDEITQDSKDVVVALSGESTPSEELIEEETELAAQERTVPRMESAESDATNLPQECDYSVGKWVPDHSRPLYSGKECKMWISPSFSCRLNKRPDMSYENFRWQPAGCDLPKFDAHAFLNLLRNKVLAFVGDSLGRQQLQSLMCMLTRGKDDTPISDVGTAFGFFTPRGARKPNGFAYRFAATNTTIVFVWTTTLARVEALDARNPASRNALHLDRPVQFLHDRLRQLDVVVLNSGHHWNGGKMKQNRLDFFLAGAAVAAASPLSSVPRAYNHTVHAVVKWASDQVAAMPGKQVFYRTLSPRHFRNGDWNTGGTCDSIRFDDKAAVVQEGDPTDPLAESATRGTRVRLLNITALSLSRGEAHISKYGGGAGGQDCLHWCLPGIPDTWNEVLFAMLSPSPTGKKSIIAEASAH